MWSLYSAWCQGDLAAVAIALWLAEDFQVLHGNLHYFLRFKKQTDKLCQKHEDRGALPENVECVLPLVCVL